MRLRSVVVLGILWAVAVVGFQLLVSARFAPERPDRVLDWTAAESGAHSHDRQIYLLEPTLRQFSAWDSEFYLSIAIRGYDDPAVRSIEHRGRRISLNFAFFPLYPAAMRALAAPLGLVLNRIAAATLAGLLLSLLGAVAGAAALYTLVRADFSEGRASRAAFYFLVFPTAFFLAQVYTEGLFVGLAFGALALARHRRIGWAALLAVLATWTRAVGVALVVPLAWTAWEDWRARGRERAALGGFLFALAPVAAFVLWKVSPLGRNFDRVEHDWFGRELLNVAGSAKSWGRALLALRDGAPATRVHHGLELAAVAGGLAACLATLRRLPAVSLFGLAALGLALTSGVAQGFPRFVLVLPSIPIALSGLGERSEVFDRAWTVASLLLFGMLATLFTFDFWVA
jgi:hypothetical protein